MLSLPPVPPSTGWEHTLRLPRDHYVRLDSNDYSVHPERGRPPNLGACRPGPGPVWCDGGLVVDHERIWARHQTITDPAHVKVAQMLRQQRFALVQPGAGADVEQRRLADYDTALGVDDGGAA